MLSYRHGFHAGNHADVIKHVLLVQLARYLGQKDKPFWFIDTHAGAGRYALDSAQASKLAEHREGIGRLWQRRDLPAAVAEYVELVRRFNPDGRSADLPGFACTGAGNAACGRSAALVRTAQPGRAAPARELRRACQAGDRRGGDGFSALKALLPPPPRRALVLIDPAYEEKRDYERVVLALKDCLARFPGGTYLLWYPRLTRLEAHELPQRLKRLPAKSWLHVTLQVRKPAADGFGMHGSGLFVINPAWTLLATLQEVMPFLVQALGVDEGAGFSLESQEP
jgi:23S rRNA (adenine2030-N6)-methyltransferase